MNRAESRCLLMLVVFTVFVVASAAAQAGEYYLSDEDAYWWYWDGTPDYEVLIPSSAFAYVQVSWGGQTALQVALDENGPMLFIGTLPLTDASEAFSALTAPWRAALRQSRTTTDTRIETEQGLMADFMVLEGSGASGPGALARMVAFKKGDRLAYLLFVGNSQDYAGTIRQYWLRAVHSFRWR